MSRVRLVVALLLLALGLGALAHVTRAAVAPTTNPGRENAQIRFLARALDSGAGEQMQAYFPEGEFFSWVLTGLAAHLPGAGPVRVFLTVTLPLSGPGIVAGLTTAFAWTFSAFATPQLVGGGKVNMVSNLVYQLGFANFNFPFAAALCVAGSPERLAGASVQGILGKDPTRTDARHHCRHLG